MRRRSAQLVKTRSGKKGYMYRNGSPRKELMHSNKVPIYVVDERFKETGEKILCKPEDLTLIGFKD